MKKSIIKQEKPEVWNSYLELVKETMKEGSLSVKTKELIATVLSVAVHCEPCVKIHAKKALKAGATSEQLAEALSVTLLMCGGPSDVWPRKIISEVLNK